MKKIRILALLLFSMMCFSAVAGHVTLSAQWDGSEDAMAPYPGTCNGADDLAYLQFNAVQVSTGGLYHLADASDGLPGDVMVAIYDTEFAPTDPETMYPRPTRTGRDTRRYVPPEFAQCRRQGPQLPRPRDSRAFRRLRR